MTIPSPPSGRSWKSTGAALITFATLLLFLPFNVLWYGIPVLWRDYPAEARRAWLTLIHGKTGPYSGVVW